LPRVEAGALVIDDQIWLSGGFFSASLQTTDDVHVLDPLTGVWNHVTDMPSPLTHQGMAFDPAAREIWIVGGFVGDHPGPVTLDVWRYNVDTDVWSAGPDLPAIRGAGGFVELSGRMHYFGGVGTDKDVSEEQHWVFDLSQPGLGWVALAPMPEARNHFSAVTHGGKIYAIGGQYRHDTNPQDLKLAHVYDPGTDTWAQIADLPKGLSHAEPSTFADATGPVLAGGRSNINGQESVREIIRYDPLADAWSELPPMPFAIVAPAVKLVGGILYSTGGGSPAVTDLLVEGFERNHVDTALLPVRLNCGGEEFSGADDWSMDWAWTIGGEWSTPGLAIGGTTEDTLYRTQRRGSNQQTDVCEYSFPVGQGAVQVKLHFAETFWGSSNRRIFDVFLENQLVLADYDIHADVGGDTAVVKTFDVLILDGTFDLRLVSSEDRPMIAAIEVTSIPGGDLTRYCIGAPNSAGPGARLDASGSISVSANNFTLHASSVVPVQPGLFIYGLNQIQIPFGAGYRCVGGGVVRLNPAQITTGTGYTSRTLDFANPPDGGAINPGNTWRFQFWYRDGALATFNLTDALSVTFTN